MLLLTVAMDTEIITFVAETITELIRFEPQICICNGTELEFD